jgi:hypothetical protein
VTCYLLGSFSLSLLLATALVTRMALFSRRRRERNSFWAGVITALFRGIPLAVLVVALMGLAVGFLGPGMQEYLATGHISLHWSRLLAGAFALFSALQTTIFALLMQVVSIWQEQRAEQLGRVAEDSIALGPT